MERRAFLSGLTAAAVTAAGGAARAQSPHPPPQPSPAQAAPPAFRSGRIQVEVRGQGPDVLLIPGLASTAAVWARTARALEPRRRVHLVSLRGFGALAAGANGQGAVSGPVAAEIRRYIFDQQLISPAVIGHSMGGQLALRLAAEGAGVGRVMTVDSAPFFPALISDRATSRDVEPLARLAYQAVLLMGDEALRAHGRQLGAELGGASDALFGTLGWQGGDRRTLAQSLYEVMTLDLRPRLPLVRAPVTVAYGWSPRQDAPRAQADALFRAGFRRLPHPARFERIEGAEHMVMIDQPARFQAAVDRFLA